MVFRSAWHSLQAAAKYRGSFLKTRVFLVLGVCFLMHGKASVACRVPPREDIANPQRSAENISDPMLGEDKKNKNTLPTGSKRIHLELKSNNCLGSRLKTVRKTPGFT